MAERVVGLGVIGGGLMGRELASAAARWVHLEPIGVRPELAVVCDTSPEVLAWYERLAPRPGAGGALALPPLERPRSGEADQLEADRRLQRRVRLHGRPRHARAPPAAPRRVETAERARDPQRRHA